MFKDGKFEAFFHENGVARKIVLAVNQNNNPYQEMGLMQAILEYFDHMIADLFSTYNLPFPGYSFLQERCMELLIDPEFEAKCPPLTQEELQLLEQNILDEGKVTAPIITWNNIILDGHNRYRIIQRHPEVSYTTIEKDFPDRFAAIVWICRNQLGRKNLTVKQKKYLIGKQYEAEKASYGSSDGFRGNQFIQNPVGFQNEELNQIHKYAGGFI